MAQRVYVTVKEGKRSKYLYYDTASAVDRLTIYVTAF